MCWDKLPLPPISLPHISHINFSNLTPLFQEGLPFFESLIFLLCSLVLGGFGLLNFFLFSVI
mgnify:CR=1 FL=1